MTRFSATTSGAISTEAICDCAAYALAISEAEPLLFQGADFAATDVEVVRWGGTS